MLSTALRYQQGQCVGHNFEGRGNRPRQFAIELEMNGGGGVSGRTDHLGALVKGDAAQPQMLAQQHSRRIEEITQAPAAGK